MSGFEQIKVQGGPYEVTPVVDNDGLPCSYVAGSIAAVQTLAFSDTAGGVSWQAEFRFPPDDAIISDVDTRLTVSAWVTFEVQFTGPYSGMTTAPFCTVQLFPDGVSGQGTIGLPVVLNDNNTFIGTGMLNGYVDLAASNPPILPAVLIVVASGDPGHFIEPGGGLGGMVCIATQNCGGSMNFPSS